MDSSTCCNNALALERSVILLSSFPASFSSQISSSIMKSSFLIKSLCFALKDWSWIAFEIANKHIIETAVITVPITYTVYLWCFIPVQSIRFKIPTHKSE